MNKNYTYLSKLGPYIKDFISLKISNGYIYREGQYQLSRFDKFCFENPNLDVGTITKEQLSIWGRKFPNENKNSRNDRISYIIKFAKYLNCIGIDAFIPPNGASRTKPIVIIPSINDLHIFFKYIDNHIYISKEKSLVHMNLCYPILFRLLYCCGMRLAEACYLERRYVNFDDNSISILQSKGIKDRKIYFSDDLSIYINKFDEAMQKIIPNRQWMFIGKNINNPLPKTSIDRIFHQFWYEAFPHWEGKYPTPHSLRYHNLLSIKTF